MAKSNNHDHGVSGLRVMLVEDEGLVALLLEDMLSDLGHDVLGPFARLAKAMEAAQREEFDVAILDVNINGEQTYALADALIARGIPFAFSTGYARTSLPDPYGSAPVLQKPFVQRDLEKTFAALCGTDMR